MSVKNITQALATQGGELVPIPPPKIDLRDAHVIRRELASVRVRSYQAR